MSLKPPSRNTAALEVKLLSHLFFFFKAGRIYFGSLSEGTVHRGSKAWQERHEVTGPLLSTVRK